MAGCNDIVAMSDVVNINGAESCGDVWAQQIYPVIKHDYEELMLTTPLRMKAKNLEKKEKKEVKEDAEVIRRKILSVVEE